MMSLRFSARTSFSSIALLTDKTCDIGVEQTPFSRDRFLRDIQNGCLKFRDEMILSYYYS